MCGLEMSGGEKYQATMPSVVVQRGTASWAKHQSLLHDQCLAELQRHRITVNILILDDIHERTQ